MHMMTHIGEKQLNQLQITRMGEKPHKCSQCGRAFVLKTELNMHMVTHAGERGHECSVCYKMFSQSWSLKRHVLIHTGQKPYECSTCSKTFRHSGNLQQHMLIHTGEKPHECYVCGKRFTQSGTLRQHIYKIHKRSDQGPQSRVLRKGGPSKSVVEEDIECCVSENEFTQSNSKISDTRKLSHQCLQCNKVFVWKINLKKHIKVKHNSGIDPDEYNEPGNQESSVSMSVLSRTDISYECPECTDVFRNPAELRDHINTHSHTTELHDYIDTHTLTSQLQDNIGTFSDTSEHDNAIPHPSEESSNVTTPEVSHHTCSHCNQEFSQLSELNQHMAILALIPSAVEDDTDMTDEFYTCPRCGKSFFLPTDLYNHTADNKCTACGSSFCEAEDLVSHHILSSDHDCNLQFQDNKTDVDKHYTDYLRYVSALDHSYGSVQT